MATDTLTGQLTREQMLALPTWAAAFADADVPEGAEALSAVPPGAAIEVVVGTWCPDCVRELTLFWRALDTLESPPFTLTYWGKGRAGGVVPERAAELDPVAVPAFVVSRDGVEVGRVVERAVDGIARDLAALLTGARTGLVSATRA